MKKLLIAAVAWAIVFSPALAVTGVALPGPSALPGHTIPDVSKKPEARGKFTEQQGHSESQANDRYSSSTNGNTTE